MSARPMSAPPTIGGKFRLTHVQRTITNRSRSVPPLVEVRAAHNRPQSAPPCSGNSGDLTTKVGPIQKWLPGLPGLPRRNNKSAFSKWTPAKLRKPRIDRLILQDTLDMNVVDHAPQRTSPRTSPRAWAFARHFPYAGRGRAII